MRIIEWPLRTATVLELHGPLTGPAAAELLDATVRRVMRTSPPRVVLSLRDVPSIDAAGLGALVTAYRRARRKGGALRLAHVSGRVKALLVVCRLVTVFETFDSVEEAVAPGSGKSPEPSIATNRATGRTESPDVLPMSREARGEACASLEESR